MSYYIDDRSISLDDLRARLEATDLVPGHRPLLDGLETKNGMLRKAGVKSVADLRMRLKTPKSRASLAGDTGLDAGYLVLLRRVVEGFFPKPQPLKVFDWLDRDMIAALEQAGIKNTRHLYEAALSDPENLAEKCGAATRDLAELITLSDLSRIQWVSPVFARTLMAANVTGAGYIGRANPEKLCEDVMQANAVAGLYKGKVGLRDIRRLVAAAGYVPA